MIIPVVETCHVFGQDEDEGGGGGGGIIKLWSLLIAQLKLKLNDTFNIILQWVEASFKQGINYAQKETTLQDGKRRIFDTPPPPSSSQINQV